MPTDWQRALAVVAHPDDLEYGAAAAGDPWTTHHQYVTEEDVERAIASLAEHRTYLSALSALSEREPDDPDDYARRLYDQVLTDAPTRADGTSALGFRLFPR